MPSIPITLIKGDKTGVETEYLDGLPVNMYAVEESVLGANGYMVTYPGLDSFATGEGIDRGGNYNERFEDHYRVSGDKLISVSASGSEAVLGTIPGTSQVRMKGFYSFNTQGVIADGKFFLYDPVGGFVEVTDPDLGDPIDGVWVDGYYFLTDGENLYHTDITDETAIDPLKFATAEFMPDPSLGLAKTQDNKVMVFGRYTLEYFVNVATTNFAFQRVETRAQKIGIVATHAKCESEGNFYITGGRRDESIGVHAVSVGTSLKISTKEIDIILAEYTEPELADMRMEARRDKNTSFIIIHLPNETICFNESIGRLLGSKQAWSIIKSDAAGDTAYRGINGVFDSRISRWIYGDRQDSRIGKLNNAICTQYGTIVEWILYSPFIRFDSMSIDKIEIDTVPGHTTENDATVAFSLTADGITYSTEWWSLYGLPYRYGHRFILRRLGYVSDWVGFKFRGVSSSRMMFALMVVDYG